MLGVLTEPEPVPTLDELRAKALGVEDLARKAQPIQIAVFEC